MQVRKAELSRGLRCCSRSRGARGSTDSILQKRARSTLERGAAGQASTQKRMLSVPACADVSRRIDSVSSKARIASEFRAWIRQKLQIVTAQRRERAYGSHSLCELGHTAALLPMHLSPKPSSPLPSPPPKTIKFIKN